MRSGITKLNNSPNNKGKAWIQKTGFISLTAFLFCACAEYSPPPGTGEKPIPPGIENQILPHTTTQDEVLTLLGEPVVRMKSATKEGHVHVFTYTYMDPKSTEKITGESLTITFDDKNLVVLSVTRGPL